MKKVTVTNEKFEADDGKQFDLPIDCMFHELREKLKGNPYYLAKIRTDNPIQPTLTVLVRLNDPDGNPECPFVIEDRIYERITENRYRHPLLQLVHYTRIVSLHKISVGDSIEFTYDITEDSFLNASSVGQALIVDAGVDD
jgi:hypothetical protein